ncbi:MAG: hypothetical protein J6B31_00720 [Bacteroidaceae bacterium]|nr:hypothetical protein [Bacteroidaceae bacterium]
MKTTPYILVSFFLLLASACTDESIINQQEGLRVSGGMKTESRVTFINDGEWTHTHWVANDAIGLQSEDEYNVPYKAISNGSYSEFSASGSTSIASEEGKKVRAYYPYNSKASGNEVPLPYTIGQSSENPAAAFLYSEATINGNSLNFTFKHVYSYLRVTLNAKMYKDNLPDGCVLSGGGIYIKSDEPISVYNATFNLNTQAITHKESDNARLFYYTPDMNYNGTQTYTYLIPILPQSNNSNVNVYLFYPQEGDTGYVSLLPVAGKTPAEGFLAGNVYELDMTGGEAANIPLADALTDFYNTTNGSSWTTNTNWLSSKAYEEWYGLNAEHAGLDYVYTMELAANNLKGTLPESFVAIMNQANNINLSWNALSGAIPDAVKNHYRWSNLGWLIVPQDTRIGGGFDLSNSNLFMPTTPTTNLIDNTQSSLKDIFSKHKFTQVVLYSASDVNGIMNQFDKSRVNQHLDYHSLGLGTVIFTATDPAADNTTLINGITEKYGSVEGIEWVHESPYTTVYYSMTYLFDSNGQLVYVAPYSSSKDNEEVHTQYNNYLRSVLGVPAEHPEFSFEFYTSSDYSKDGEVFTIQNATVGNGIDLIFLGEGFVDTDMTTGGKYETKMKEAADKLFELEPYKSFRNRFNLYGVKVVSPTAEFTEGAEKRIKNDYATAFEYAEKYDANLPEDARMMIVVIYNTESYVDRSYCGMYSNGDFVAFNMTAANNTLIHEVGGHGIAKLADEYVEGGYENTTLPASEKQNLDTYFGYDWGWYANVDYNSTASTIRWSRMLSDSRYKNDGLGIYEGAFTYGKGVYRPSENSMMLGNISWFNAPSREAIYKAIMTLSEGDSWTYSYEDFVSYDEKNLTTTASTSRSAMKVQSAKELQEVLDRHRKPELIRGSLRNAAKNAKNKSITVPLR